MKALTICFILFFSTQTFASNNEQNKVENGEDLIRLMYSTYSLDWYKHLTFKQNMFRYRGDSLIRNEIWLVAYNAPNKLHIRYKDFDSGRGWLIVNDTLYSYNHNKLIGQRHRLHELMLLGYDAYIVSPEVVIPKIKEIGFNMDKMEITTIKGKEVYQVGDGNKMCFWVCKDNLLFYGIRKSDDSGVRETFYENYKQFYGKPVATEIQYFENGNMYLYEKYFEIRLPSSLPEDFFNPNLFQETRW
jgi:hypothetical protein